jgi:small subunit ribosomal protein S7
MMNVSDPIYNSVLVTLLMRRVLKSGKRGTAEKIVYKSLKTVVERSKLNPIVVLEMAIKNVAPRIKIKTRRRGASLQKFPKELRAANSISVGLKWLTDSARSRPGNCMEAKLAAEILDASKCRGASYRKKILLQKGVQRDRQFYRYRLY